MKHMTRQKGFTLVEVLVAIAVLAVGLVPAFQMATSAIAISGTVRNSLTASFLAQEGLEVVRAMRDTNWFTSLPFDDTLLAKCQTGCMVQYNSTTDKIIASTGSFLKQDPTSGLFQYNTGNDTLFKRTVTITEPNPYELKVVSAVDWTDKGKSNSISVEYHLFNWWQ
jgi:prepilin-type N-terminal cleavage/methylation domain-containing protein